MRPWSLKRWIYVVRCNADSRLCVVEREREVRLVGCTGTLWIIYFVSYSFSESFRFSKSGMSQNGMRCIRDAEVSIQIVAS